MPNYLDDLKKAIQELSSGDTILTDATQMKTSPPDIVTLHMEAQKVTVATGLAKTAEIVGQDIVVKMASNRFSKASGMPKGTFDNKADAEAWLDILNAH